MNDNEEKLVQNVLIWGAVIGVGYIILNKVGGSFSSFLGLDPNGAQNQQAVQTQVALPNNQNPFSASYAPFINFYNNNGPNDSAGNLIPISNFFSSVPNFSVVPSYGIDQNENSIWSTLDVVALSKMASDLNNNLSSSLPLISNSNSVLADLNQLTSKMGCAFVANYFLYNYNADLLDALRGSLLSPGLSNSDLATIISKINNLPVNNN